MNNKRDSEVGKFGISGLPRRWAITVQLVGTFGLAVFLVLYYIFVMQPREAAQYENLRESVESMMHVVEKQQSLLTREQASRLETLYVLAVAPEVVDRIIGGLEQNIAPEVLARGVEDAMRVRASLLDGLTRKDGGKVSEMLTNKIRDNSIARAIVESIKSNLPRLDKKEIIERTEEYLEIALRRAAFAK